MSKKTGIICSAAMRIRVNSPSIQKKESLTLDVLARNVSSLTSSTIFGTVSF